MTNTINRVEICEAAKRLRKMRSDSDSHDGGYPNTTEGRAQSWEDHARLAEAYLAVEVQMRQLLEAAELVVTRHDQGRIGWPNDSVSIEALRKALKGDNP